jgi:hypothetical protein
MLINAFIEIRDDFDFEREDNVETLAKCGDINVIPGLFKRRAQGPRSWQLYSLLYEVDTRQQFEQAIERFKSENPGTTDVLGAWHFEDGRQAGIELDGSGVPLYPIPGRLSDFMPDDPDGTPNPTVRDVNLYYGQAHRDFV